LIGLTRGFIVANGEDGASEVEWKGWELLPIWINEGAGITSPMRFGRPGTFFRDCRERVLSDLPDLHHVNSRRRVVWFKLVYQTEIRNMVTLSRFHEQVWYAGGVLGCRVQRRRMGRCWVSASLGLRNPPTLGRLRVLVGNEPSALLESP
jgi:hypothetical protein